MLFRAQVARHRVLTPADAPWVPADLDAMLQAAEFDDIDAIPADELRDMCLLALQDLGLADAAKVVLTHHLSGRLKRGQIDNLSHELGDEKQWEHYADMSLHEGLFHVCALLWEVFPSELPTPDAVWLELALRPDDDEARELLATGFDEPFLVRLLADGQDDRSMLHRLFDDQIAGARFDEAGSIVWTFAVCAEPWGARVQITGSKAWLGPLRDADPWTSQARPDLPEEAEEG